MQPASQCPPQMTAQASQGPSGRGQSGCWPREVEGGEGLRGDKLSCHPSSVILPGLPAPRVPEGQRRHEASADAAQIPGLWPELTASCTCVTGAGRVEVL
jgi:hypothetical protein